MGRPIKKIHIGERGAGNAGGEGLASVTLGGTNNSTGAGAGDALTIGVPDLVGGVQAAGTVAIYADGALLEGVTTLPVNAGLGVSGAIDTYADVATTSSGTGTGVTLTIVKTGGVTNYSDITVTITAIGSGYDLVDTLTVDGSLIGGTVTTNDLILDIDTFVTNGTISGTTITTAGDGYTSVPTVSQTTGTQGTLSMTGVLTATNAAVIAATAYITNSNDSADIKAQKGNTTYKVTTVDGTLDCTLVQATPAAVGEMAIVATDSGGVTYYVVKLTNNLVTLETFGAGSPEFADGVKVKWADTAVLNDSVKITS